MKKAISILTCLLFCLTVLNFAGEVLCSCLGYAFKLNNIPVYTGTLTLLSVSTVVLSVLCKDSDQSNAICSLLVLLLPFSLINFVLYAFSRNTFFVYSCSIVSTGCTFFLVIWNGKYCASKIIALVLTAILLVPIGFFGLLGVLFADFGHVAVVQTVVSPSGKYRAEVIDVDQGALGGNTLVEVYNNSKHFNFFVFTISKKPQQVYTSEWGAFKNMKIRWKDDDCLIINGKKYEIK